MSDRGSVLGVAVSSLDMHCVTTRVVDAARERKRLGVSAIAVHGIVLAVRNQDLRTRLNALDIVTPDGQPVRWALNIMYGAGLEERVYGPDLMLDVCKRACGEGLPVFLYGSTDAVLNKLAQSLHTRYPGLEIAGKLPSRFRPASEEERAADLEYITSSGTAIVFVGLGCPRQEIWVYENMEDLSMPLLAVGAAFDYHAGNLKEPPKWVQRAGLQWLHRLAKEPRRLWRRYLLLNPVYLGLLFLQGTRLRRFPVRHGELPITPLRPG